MKDDVKASIIKTYTQIIDEREEEDLRHDKVNHPSSCKGGKDCITCGNLLC